MSTLNVCWVLREYDLTEVGICVGVVVVADGVWKAVSAAEEVEGVSLGIDEVVVVLECRDMMEWEDP